MRLIDADQLIKDGWHLRRSGRSNKTLSTMSIADVPTAYDLDKVINHLAVERAKALYLFDNNSRYKGYIKAIEIVEGGVANET